MMDAVLIGLNAVLLQIRIPKVEYKWLQTLEKDEQQIDLTRIAVKDSEVRKLKLKEIPVFSSFALYVPRGKTEVSDDFIILIEIEEEHYFQLLSNEFARSFVRIAHYNFACVLFNILVTPDRL